MLKLHLERREHLKVRRSRSDSLVKEHEDEEGTLLGKRGNQPSRSPLSRSRTLMHIGSSTRRATFGNLDDGDRG